MLVEAIVCVNCGGPLAAVTSLPAVVECSFCGVSLSLSHGQATVTRRATIDEVYLTRLREARARFVEQLSLALGAGRPPYEALREASATHLGTGGQTDTLARVAIALAHDFKRETKASIADALILARIAEGYLKAVEELRDRPQTELDLPFLTATPSGPLHLRRVLSPQILAELGARDPNERGGAGPKKRKWWPF